MFKDRLFGEYIENESILDNQLINPLWLTIPSTTSLASSFTTSSTATAALATSFKATSITINASNTTTIAMTKSVNEIKTLALKDTTTKPARMTKEGF